MAKIIENFRAWCKAIADESRCKHVRRREREAKAEALRRVQVTEFGGELFFCFDGIPLLHEDDLTTDLGSATREARAHFRDYRMTQDRQNV